MNRFVTGTLLVASVLIPAGLAGPARADIVAVSVPTAVSISGPAVSFSGTVRVGSAEAGLRSASLWFQYPNTPAAVEVGTATSRRPGFLAFTANLDATRIIPGLNQIQVQDDADGDTRTMVLDLRRVSRVSITHAEFRTDGTVALAVRVRHYDAARGRLIPSRLSPVLLQEKVLGAWVPVSRVITDRSGLAGAVVAAGPGQHYYRAVRPNGATVLTATSKTIRTGRTTGAMIVP
jgi:hypothetical protein